MSRVLLTGATGFLGMEVLVRLLERSDHEVLCLVRADDRDAAEARLDDVLAKLYVDPSQHRARVRALPGDLTAGVEAPDEEIDVVCHCAASIAFDLSLDEAREINVDGTRTVLELARATGARRFVHVSTAYVSGTHSGEFTEDMLGSEFRNTYEQTKCEAERMVGEVSDMEVAIARPSIVMGESDSGWTPAFNVLYWPLRAFSRGLFAQVPAEAGRARRRRAGRLRRRRHLQAGRVRRDRDVQPRQRSRTPRPARSWRTWPARTSAARGRRSWTRASPPARRATAPARSTCRTSTWRSCSTTPARASCSGSSRRRCGATSTR